MGYGNYAGDVLNFGLAAWAREVAARRTRARPLLRSSWRPLLGRGKLVSAPVPTPRRAIHETAHRNQHQDEPHGERNGTLLRCAPPAGDRGDWMRPVCPPALHVDLGR